MRRAGRRRAQTGFTLLELLVALAVFAVIAVAAYSGLQSVLTTERAVREQAQRLSQVQMAFLWLERDLRQAVLRGIRDEYGLSQPALSGGALETDLVTLTRAGWDNPLGQERATLQRLAYRLDTARLVRLYWDTLDRSGVSEPRELVLLEEVSEAQVRFLDEQGEWHPQWPPRDAPQAADAPETPPRAVEVSLRLDDWGEVTRLFPLAQGPELVRAPAPPGEEPDAESESEAGPSTPEDTDAPEPAPPDSPHGGPRS